MKVNELATASVPHALRNWRKKMKRFAEKRMEHSKIRVSDHKRGGEWTMPLDLWDSIKSVEMEDAKTVHDKIDKALFRFAIRHH